MMPASTTLRRALIALFALASLPWSQAAPAADSSDPELLALLNLLEEETSVATHTRMNADFVPGMVSVLQADDLRRQGLTTVAEALGRVAGFFDTVDNVGDTRLIVRGVGATLNASNLRILLDGAAVNRPVDASADWALRLPLSQVERIEVVRGPGSALYGEFAFSGVVNIVTRKGLGGGLRVGSHRQGQADARLEHRFGGGARLSLGVSAWHRGNSGLLTAKDNFANSDRGYSPGQVYDHENGRLLLAEFEQAGYRLQLHHANTERGGWYGRLAAMPGDLDPRVERVTGLQLGKSWELGDKLDVSASLGWLQTRLDTATYLPIPAGIDPPGPRPALDVDQFRRTGNSDRSNSADISLKWTGLDHHAVFIGLGYAHSRVTSAFTSLAIPGRPTQFGSATETLVVAGSTRTLRNITLQDQWHIGEALELTLGVRHDHYGDWGGHLSPRIAAVWRPAEQHIVKLQYSEAFRPPTLEERYPGPDSLLGGSTESPLREELIRSLEAAYIQRGPDHRLRVTAFYTRIADLIEYVQTPGRLPVWRNRGDIHTAGAELEWEQHVGRHWRWNAGLAYVNARDRLDVDRKLLGAVNVQARLGVVWRGKARTSHSLNARYTGPQEGWELQTRQTQTERFAAYTTFDYAVMQDDWLAIDGLRLSAGVKNLTDRRYRSVATPAQFASGLTHGERSFWLALEYEH
jgi:outer membrane receptor for ferrienterochelin and colicins